MRTNFQKSYFNKIVIADIPFAPFQPGSETENRITDYVANRMLQVAKNEKRYDLCRGCFDRKKDKHFIKSKTIVAIDASNVTATEVTYLNYIKYVLRVHPCIVVNCNIPIEELKQLPIHDWLYRKGYILPIFRRTPAVDMDAAAARYGDSFIKLLSGQESKVDTSDFNFLDENGLFVDVLERFPGLAISNDRLTHRPDIVWLGVDSKETAHYLTDLFNYNKSSFSLNEINEKDSKFNLDNFVNKDRSMLFGNDGINHDQIQFRLLKKNIFTQILHALFLQFETKLINNMAIDTSHGQYPGFLRLGDRVEYHTVGKIFDSEDTFPCKLICYIRQCFQFVDYDTIALIDNGNEESLFSLLQKMFFDKNVIRIINYFNNPIIYPFDNIDKYSNIVIITDVINSGSLINKTCKYLESIKCKVKAVFTFIISHTASRQKIFNKIPEADLIPLFCYTEKKLTRVDKARIPDHKKRFLLGNIYDNIGIDSKTNSLVSNFKSSTESFLFFWQSVDELCDCNCEYSSCEATSYSQNKKIETLRSRWCHHIYPKKIMPGKNLQLSNSHLKLYISNLVAIHDVNCVCIACNHGFEFYQKLISEINNRIYIYNVSDMSNIDSNIYRQNNILVIFTWLNLGFTAVELIKKIKQNCTKSTTLSCFTLYHRTNVIEETFVQSHNNLKILNNMNISVYCYHNSDLPFYFYDKMSGKHTYIDSTLQTIYPSGSNE